MVNKIIFSALLALLTGCGVAQQQAGMCGGDFEQGCTTLFGFPDDKSADKEQDAAIKALQTQLGVLMSAVDQNILQIDSLYSAILMLQGTNNSQDAQIDVLNQAINSLQLQINAQTAQIASLGTGDRVVDYLNCGGDGPGFDEIVVRMSSGKLLAYFKDSGSREFLTLLTPGSYQTTDASRCSFTVTATNQFCDAGGCR